MAQSGDHHRLALKPTEDFRIVGILVEENLDRYITAKRFLARSVDFGDSTLTDFAGECILADLEFFLFGNSLRLWSH